MMPNTKNPLAQFTATRETGAGFVATREGGLALVTPLTARARSWLGAYVDTEASWVGKSLVVEPRYFPSPADAIIAAGFLFERDAFPN